MSRQQIIERFRRARSGGPGGDLTVLEGFHPLKHALRFDAEILEAVTSDPARPMGLARELAPDVSTTLADFLSEIPPEVFDEVCPRPPSSGVVAVARRASVPIRAILEESGPAPVVYLQHPMHLGNLGAAVRVAAAAGAHGVVVTSQHDPWHPRALRGSAGLHYAVPVAAAPDLPRTDRPLVAVDPGGEPLAGCGDLPPGAVLAFGSERRGLDPDVLERAVRRIRIPMRSGVSSLNLATSVAVLLYAGRLGGE